MRQTWRMAIGIVLCLAGLVIAAQEHTWGLYVAVVGGVVAVTALVARD